MNRRDGVGPESGGRADAPALSVVIPAFNEESVIAGTVDAIASYLDARGVPFELLVVDDGSRDGTAAAAAAAGARFAPRVQVLRRETNAGKGGAVQHGVAHARGTRILFCDADLSTPIEEVEALAAAIDEGCDLAFGSRWVEGSRIEVRQPPHRVWMGRAFNGAARALVLPGVRDTQCGFKLFTREAARRVFPDQTVGGFCFDLEILYLARRQKLRLREVPVRWRDRRESRVRTVRDPLAMFLDVLRIRFARRRGPRWRFVDGATGPGTVAGGAR